MSFYCPLPLWDRRPVALAQFWCPGSSGQAARGPGSLPSGPKRLPQSPALGQFLVFTSVPFAGCWQLGSDSGALNTSAKHHAKTDPLSHRQVGSEGVAEPVSGLRVAVPPSYIVMHMKNKCVCKEHMMIIF